MLRRLFASPYRACPCRFLPALWPAPVAPRLPRIIALMVLLVASAAGPVLAADADACDVRGQDEWWLVSARHVFCVAPGDAPPLHVERYEPESGWSAASIEHAAEPASPDQIIVIYVHGNRVPSDQVISEGRYVYRQLTAGCQDATPLRFVMWSWPSAQLRGPLRDVRTKAQRTELHGYCLGWFLAQLPDAQRVSLLGYSFGARIATGAVHLLGGGSLSGRNLPCPEAGSPHTRIVMLAAALHDTWLRPGGYHEQALPQLAALLNLYNCCDPVLKRYPRLAKHSRATALGFRGMWTGDLGELVDRVEQVDASPIVMKSHEARLYLADPGLRERIREVMLWHADRSHE